MFLRAAHGGLFALALLLAGCLGAEEPMEMDHTGGMPAADEAGPAPVDTGSGGEEVVVGTGDRPHLHDYWDGKERITLFEGTLTPGDQETLDATFYALWINREATAGGMLWRLPDGSIVFEGTGQLDVTASWSDPRTTGVSVSYRSGAGPEYSEAQPLESGEFHSIPVAPDMMDMPHMTTSRWEFYFAPSASPGAMLGPFDLKIEIVKMRDVTLFPAHPDLFEGKSEKVLLDADGRSAQVSYAKRVPNLILEGAFGEHEIPLADLVPMETKLMRFEVELRKASASVGEVSEIRFFYRSPGSQGLQPADLVSGSVEEGFLVWEVPVEMEMTDTPYGEESQWAVMVEAATTLTGMDPTCGGCVDTEIEFHVRATAYDHEAHEDAAAGAAFS